MHLDNKEILAQSQKVQSKIGEKEKKNLQLLNENHARELMELHTVSPEAGYTQEDVQELAKIMTGWRP